jgi:hypothetical protein
MDGSRRILVGGAVLVLVALVASCSALFSTKIRAIKENPGAFDGREVAIAGQVTSSWNLVFVKYYKVRDNTGEIYVVTESALPHEGDHVRVKGKVDQAFAIGGNRMVVVVERAPRR